MLLINKLKEAGKIRKVVITPQVVTVDTDDGIISYFRMGDKPLVPKKADIAKLPR